MPTQDTKKKPRRKLPHSLLQNSRTNRQMRIVENLLATMTTVVQRRKKQLQSRNLLADERAWRSHINYCMAMAHLSQFYQRSESMHGGQSEQRYSQSDVCCFSLAYSGVIMRKNSSPSSENKVELKRDCSLRDGVMAQKEEIIEEAIIKDVSVTKEITNETESSSPSVEQQTETPISDSDLLLDSARSAALHLRRAMVSAHRGNHWTTSQHVCQTSWDQNHRLTTTMQQVASSKISPQITANQLHPIFTPLSVLATDLMLDMSDKLQIWSLYDLDSTAEELECRLHFSPPLDDCCSVDSRWVRTLVLYTLEQSYDCGKWETSAHFALSYNSYTRERYALVIAPSSIHSQRKSLERISSFGGPAVPQPHYVKTQNTTGKEITNRSYASCQLLSGWTPYPENKQPIHKKATLTTSSLKDAHSLKVSEMELSMSLVLVPLDVEDTSSCYREALGKRPHCLQVLQHSRSLLVQLLAGAQPCFPTQLPRSQARGRSTSQVNFSPTVVSTPNLLPDNSFDEDFSTPKAIYCLPISPNSITTVAAAYSNSIKYLKDNYHDSLKVLALHEMGNSHFYAGNKSAAHLCWSKAVDCAFQSSQVIQKWNGASFESGSLQNTVNRAGLWGCLQGAVLTAKIAQLILTSDVSERSKCCSLSAHFFKCVSCCSMAHSQTDLQYASYNIGEESFPGIDLFSEPHRLQVGTTVTSLHFVCHWLFATGYYITLLPILALYLHFVGHVCRDVQRTAEGKILKVRALTELCMFTEAITETVQLTQGADSILPSGLYFAKANSQPPKLFCSSKSLPDNVEVLEDLVNCDFTSEVCTLYRPTSCSSVNLARIQLILAITKSECGSAVSDSEESCTNREIKGVEMEQEEQERVETEGMCPKAEKPKVVTLCNEKEKLTTEMIKCLLLEGASTLLSSAMQSLTSLTCSEAEKSESLVHSNLLKANLSLQQGNYALSSEIAVSSLVLSQTSAVIVKQSPPGSKQEAIDSSVSNCSHGDSSRAVEACERIDGLSWSRCRSTLVHSSAANIPATATLFPGKNINEAIAQVIQEGSDECVQWGDQDIQASLMVEAAELEAKRGRIDESMGMLQKAVNSSSGRTCMPPGSISTSARAASLLNDSKKGQSKTLLHSTQKLLEKQSCSFGQNVTFLDGNMSFSPPGPRNIYLPSFNMSKKYHCADWFDSESWHRGKTSVCPIITIPSQEES